MKGRVAAKVTSHKTLTSSNLSNCSWSNVLFAASTDGQVHWGRWTRSPAMLQPTVTAQALAGGGLESVSYHVLHPRRLFLAVQGSDSLEMA